MNFSERYFYEWAEQPDGGCPTLEEYTEAFRELARQAEVALQRQQMANYNRALADIHAAQIEATRRTPSRQYQQPQTSGTFLGQVIGRTGFARLLVNAEGRTRIVESDFEEQAAKAEGWKDPNRP